MSVSCEHCETRYSKWNLLVYLFNYLDPYIMCSCCMKDSYVEPAHQSKVVSAVKTIGLILIFLLIFLAALKLLIPSESINNDEYFDSERGQLYAKMRNPFNSLIMLSCVSVVITFFVTMPIHRYLNWKSFTQHEDKQE